MAVVTKVWAVMLVRDEADVIAYTLRQLVDEGVDGIIVANNRSCDDTASVIASEGERTGVPVLVENDDEIAFYQGRKTTALARKAASRGADWIVPCDADECWYNRGVKLGDYLRALPATVLAVRVERYTHLRTGRDVPGWNPYMAMPYRVRARDWLPKMACRYADDMAIHDGNHGVSYGGAPQVLEPSTVELRHFPYRSSAQLLRKIRNGTEGLRATDLPGHMGVHWRQLGERMERSGKAVFLREVWFQSFYVSDPGAAGMVYDPAPYCRWSAPKPRKPNPAAEET